MTSYRDAGVDIDAGNRTVRLLAEAVGSTATPRVSQFPANSAARAKRSSVPGGMPLAINSTTTSSPRSAATSRTASRPLSPE